MILSNALLVIETILFLVSGRLHGDESLSQRFSYYIGGWVGLIYFSWLLMASFMGYDINIIITLIVMVPLATADLVVVPAFPFTDGMGVFRSPLSFNGIFEP